MKARKEHRVPLSNAALAILDTMKAGRVNHFIFPGREPNTSLSGMALLLVLRRMKRTDVTPHGMRSSFADWVTESTNFPTEMREMALAHSVGTSVEQAYRRTDMVEKRRQLMEAWALHCGAQPSDNVHPLRSVSA
jgi:integrase